MKDRPLARPSAMKTLVEIELRELAAAAVPIQGLGQVWRNAFRYGIDPVLAVQWRSWFK